MSTISSCECSAVDWDISLPLIKAQGTSQKKGRNDVRAMAMEESCETLTTSGRDTTIIRINSWLLWLPEQNLHTIRESKFQYEWNVGFQGFTLDGGGVGS